MRDRDAMVVLKRVSRSFFLSVRLLPWAMRRGVCAGYLLARASDTLADAPGVPPARRVEWLDAFGRALDGGPWHAPPHDIALSPGERMLMDELPRVLEWATGLPSDQAVLVREVVDVIVGGQRLDLSRFAAAGPGRAVVLPDDAALDDYTWRVAGCVGRFWTRLGFATLGTRFSMAGREDLDARGVDFGKGLQLVNILRDLRADLAEGRCYLPVADAADAAAVMDARRAWCATARRHLACGEAYAEAMALRRLRVAVRLPAWIGRETLDLVERQPDAPFPPPPVKIPRRRVRSLFVRAWF